MIKDWTKQEILDVYNTPLLELISKASEVHKKHHTIGEVQISSLLSIKTGGCPEDCAYCPQAARYNTEVKVHKLMGVEEVSACADNAKAGGASRMCLGAAWREVRDNKDFDKVLDMVKTINSKGLEVCATLGMVTEEQADVAGGSGKSEIETMMHKAEATLMQALAPARVKIGPAITAYLNQLHNVTTLCLPNSIPADADSTTGNLNGQPLRALCTRLTSHTLTRSPSAIARLSNLTDLNLDYNPVCLLGESAASALVTCLSALSRIQRLSLCGSCLSVSCFEQLHSQVFKTLSGLVDLRLSFNFELGRSEFTRTLPRDLPRLRVLKLASVMMSAEDTTAVITCAV